MRNHIFIVSDNINRVNAIRKTLEEFINLENIIHIGSKEFLTRSFNYNVIIIAEQLQELEAIRVSDMFVNDETNVIIDLYDNFPGLPLYDKVIYLPEITYDHAGKIVQKNWDELTITSNINKFARFKDKEVKTRKFDHVRFEEVEQEIEALRTQISEYEDTILDLKKIIEDTNTELDKKIDELQAKEVEIRKLNDIIKNQQAEHERDTIRLKNTIEDLQDREERYKRMLDEVSKKYDLVGFVSSYKFKDRKRRMIREAKEQGKKIVGIVGKGKKFILNSIEQSERFLPVIEPEQADYWIIVTTPDKQAVELFKELVMSKPLNKSLKIMTLWNDGYPFTPESLVESDLDLIIPYYKDAHKLEWLGESADTNWRLELNNLVKYIVS